MANVEGAPKVPQERDDAAHIRAHPRCSVVVPLA
jgi:hypothetical protein